MLSNEQSEWQGDSEEDELNWEEVNVPEHRHLEITLHAPTRPKEDEATKKKGVSHAERLCRIDCHKMHTVTLLANAWHRNHWINDPLLHARLLSLTPLSLQNSFAIIHKSRFPEKYHRGRMFETAIVNLTEWWSTFFEVTFDGHIRNRTYDEVQTSLTEGGFMSEEEGSAMDLEAWQEFIGEYGEVIRSPKSLMKHALMRSGSRDTSAQIFCALCRALGIPTRLVVSLQSVPWQVGVGKPKPTYKRKKRSAGKGKGKMVEEPEPENEEANGRGSDSDDMEEVEIRGSRSSSPVPFDSKGKGRDDAFPSVGQRNPPESNIESSVVGSSRLATPDPVHTPPVFWAEVFSRPDARWLPVDPIRSIVNKRKVFYPSSSTPGAGISRGATVQQDNRMVYVLAFEEDGYARDVTRRYAKEYNSKVAKVQGGSSAGGKSRYLWWGRVVGAVTRPYRLRRDDIEDEELEEAQIMEGMPTTIAGFKDHPLYVLPRHLKQTEVIHPAPPETKEIGKFRSEPVYPRSSVVPVKTAENWLRSEGRMVMEGSQPLKFNKIRASTVNRMRELEVLKDELREAGEQSSAAAGGDVMQALYARSQTEPYVPEPVIDGKVPKNSFGNIDLYVSSMLPKGAAHLPFKGIAKIARALGFDYAEAVTGFEFKKRRAFPVIEGVVVAKENETTLLEAYWEAEQDAEAKALAKREERVLKLWTRLIQGLRIRRRLQEQYATNPREKQLVSEPVLSAHTKDEASLGGGFLTAADDVVQPFHLPKQQYPQVTSSFPTPSMTTRIKADDFLASTVDVAASHEYKPPDKFTYDLQTMDLDSDQEIPLLPIRDSITVPKTMQEMAESSARAREAQLSTAVHDDEEHLGGDANLTGGEGKATSSKTRTSAGTSTSRARRESRKSSSATPSSVKRSTQRRTRASRRGTSGQNRGREEETDEETASNSNDGSSSNVESSVPPKKRMRNDLGMMAPSPSTRTLRPRAPKTPAQIQQEKEQEEAFRRAITE